MESAVKNITMATTLLDARSMCSPKRFVRSGPSPCVANHGMSTRKPKKLRKNATSKGCISAETQRTLPCMMANITAAAAIRSAPRRTFPRSALTRTLRSVGAPRAP